MTIQTAVLIETLVDLGAEVRWASCNIFSTQDHAAAAIAVGRTGTPKKPAGVPVFAWKGESLEEYWWCTEQALRWPDADEAGSHGPNMLLDDGGDATLLIHKGVEFEKAGKVPDPSTADNDEYAVILGVLGRLLGEQPKLWHEVAGEREGRHRGDHDRCAPPLPDARSRHAAVPGDQRERLGHEVEVRQPLRLPALADRRHQPRHRRDDRGQGRGRVRLRRRRQGLRAVTARPGRARRSITEIDPICALQAAMEGYQVTTLEDVVGDADIFVTTTGNMNVISVDSMAKMKHNAIVGNIGHFDTEIDMAGLTKFKGIERKNVKPQVDEWVFPDGHAIIVLAEGRLLNLGCATGHPSFVMSNSFTNQVIAQIELFTHTDFYERRVYTLPKHLDEKVARLHLDKLGVKLTTLTEEQAAYIGVPVEGPYKPDIYRY